MKRLRIILSCVLAIPIVFVFVDLNIFRGYYLGEYFFIYDYSGAGEKFDYEIEPNADGSYRVSIRNKTLFYYPIAAYRYSALEQWTDSAVVNYALRYQIISEDSILFDTGGGFDCGTDLGVLLIRPFERISLNRGTAEDLVRGEDYLYHVVQASQKFEMPSTTPPTLQLRLYLPVAGLGEEDRRVYSNIVSIDSDVFRRKMAELKTFYAAE